ncbi:TIGR03084 family metal-binding protein [Streptomyces specialis]|uniref:TIGR03084 family metal-binding protein n=1 Tax=Streptomyces specialis TaxID=498367 RepID=UPI00073E5E82|nr:TIGR03084 family metal-binding protein [Streptomyces specialis]
MTDTAVLADLAAEGDALDLVVRDLPPEGWRTPTPAPGWTIAHQIAHLAWTDGMALLAATDAAGFQAELDRAATEADGYIDRAAERGAARPGLLAHWREGRGALAGALAAVPDGARVPWFGPPMSATSMATARLMETWAHGQDVADALGIRREPTARLRNVAHIGVRARDFAYIVNGRTPPARPFRVELTGPGGELWTWGPADAGQRVTGPALDFCLLVTQRRHRDDLAVTAEGAEADAWLGIAQAFAGPPGPGRAPGEFA